MGVSNIKPGVSDIFTKVPGLAKQFDPALNPDIDMTKQGTGSHEKVTWRCDKCGEVWEASIYSRIRKNSDGGYDIRLCPVCGGNKRSKSMAEEFPQLVSMFDEVKNGMPLSAVTGNWHKKYWWICDKNPNHGFEAPMSSMKRALTTGNNGCPYCHGTKVLREESFGAKHPELVSEWSEKNDLSPFDVTEMSKKDVIWKCEKGHEWTAAVQVRAAGYAYCKQCYPYGKNEGKPTAASRGIRKYYSPNNQQPLEAYSAGSNRKILLRCENGHEFERVISNISEDGTISCPVCSGRKVIAGVNDLASQYPEYTAFYNSEKNAKLPNEISANDSNYDTWWKCDQGHEFQRPVRVHVMYLGVCPICSNHVLQPGINDLRALHPEIIDHWSKKNGRGPETCTENLQKYFWFTCKEGHQYRQLLQEALDSEYDCPVCAGEMIVEGVNTLLDTDPELASELSPNETKKPTELTKSYRYKALWRCPVCGGDYRYPVAERQLNDESCPYCNQDRLLYGFNTLSDTHPLIAAQYDPSNDKPISSIRKSSTRVVRWICEYCGCGYWAAPVEMDENKNICPFCNNKKVNPGVNSLDVTYPELAKEWSPNNDRGPETVMKTFRNAVLWICPDCGQEYLASPYMRELGDSACKYCHGRLVKEGVNSLVDTDPELAKEWSDRNDRKPGEFKASSYERVWWKCQECGQEYREFINRRHSGDEACPFCYGRRVQAGYNSLADTDPELAKELSPRNEFTAWDISKSRIKTAIWVCPVCGDEYHASPADRHLGDCLCPTCKGLRAKAGYNSLLDIDPELAKEWSEKNDRGPETVTRNFANTVWWTCPQCNGDYLRAPKERSVGDDSCPFCKGWRILPGVNTLADTNPVLASEWSPNNERTADSVMKSFTDKYKWICPECGGEYWERVVNRSPEGGSDDCPYCNDKKPLKGYNTLADRYPELVDEWSDIENYALYMESDAILPSSTKIAFWNCSLCKHTYTKKITDYVLAKRRGHNPCPYCNGRIPRRYFY